MDSVHDLGGKQGLGPIDTRPDEFRHDWEWRQWALSKCVAWGPGMNIDTGRWIIETIPGPAYLSMPYFGKWCLRDLAMGVVSGVLTLEEARSGETTRTSHAPPARDLDDSLAALKANEAFFDGTAESPPRFAPGQRITTLRAGPPGHTRLPAYARAARGTVIAHHGAHVFPDDNAHGQKTFHHLYTVAFDAPDLWPEADGRDAVHLDLWEPYFVAA